MRFSYLWIGLFWLSVLAWGLILWKLSSIPGNELPQMHFANADKVAHFGYFFIGGVLLSASLLATFRLRGWQLFILVLVIMSQVGAGDERHQVSTPNRSGDDRYDWMADCAGAGTAALVVAWVYAFRKRRRLSSAPSL